MSPDLPPEMLVTVTLQEQGGKTKPTLVHAGMPSGEDRELA
jgi:hypothetical protein